MATVNFDTLKFVERLKAAGAPEAQAKAEAEPLALALSEAMESQLATKIDINRIERAQRGQVSHHDTRTSHIVRPILALRAALKKAARVGRNNHRALRRM